MAASMFELNEELAVAMRDSNSELLVKVALQQQANVATLEQELLVKLHALAMAEATAINSGACEGKNTEAREALLHGATANERKDVMLVESHLVMAKAQLETVRWAKQLMCAKGMGKDSVE